MLPAARIQAVIELLDLILSTPKPADGLVSAYFRDRRFIGSKDRAAVSTRFYHIVRCFRRLGWHIEQGRQKPTARNLALADLILNDNTENNINEIFSGARFCPLPLDDDERYLARFLKGRTLHDAAMPEDIRVECPDWAKESLMRALGKDFIPEMTAMLSQAPMDLRVNTIKTTREELLQELKSEGFEVTAGKISPLCIRITGRPQIIQHPLFQNGYFEIQDEGSQMVAFLADAKPGEQVADFCAGAGGKTLAMGAAMKNKGRIVAMDVMDRRLNRAKERFRRAGLHNIETRALTSERDKYVKRHDKSFDLVLVDAPCSGVGTWRRDPDKRWRQLGPGLDALVPLQKQILDSAARMVKNGGRLVYATCSLLPDENADQIKSFLVENADFSIRPVADVLGPEAKSLSDANGFLQMTPARHDTDGFFAALLVRKSA